MTTAEVSRAHLKRAAQRSFSLFPFLFSLLRAGTVSPGSLDASASPHFHTAPLPRLQSGVLTFTLEVTSVRGDEVQPQLSPLWFSFQFFFSFRICELENLPALRRWKEGFPVLRRAAQGGLGVCRPSRGGGRLSESTDPQLAPSWLILTRAHLAQVNVHPS